MTDSQLQEMFEGLLLGTVAGSALIMSLEGLYAQATLNALIVCSWFWFRLRPMVRSRSKSRQT